MSDALAKEDSSPPHRHGSRRMFCAVHLATSILVLAAQVGIRTEEMLHKLMFPLGLLALGVFVFSVVQTIRLGAPRTPGFVLTLLLLPGCAIPFLGPILYLGLSVIFLMVRWD